MVTSEIRRFDSCPRGAEGPEIKSGSVFSIQTKLLIKASVAWTLTDEGLVGPFPSLLKK